MNQNLGDVGGGNPYLSKYFTLADLTVTSQHADNTPDASSLENLKKLAALLDLLYDNIGPFKVLSAFRSQAVENALTASGQPTAEAAGGKVSFHTVGLGADIYPTFMSLDVFFGNILALMGTEEAPGILWNQMSEVAYKPNQNSIHLAAAVDYRQNNVVLALGDTGKYGKLSWDEIASFADPFIAKSGEIFDDIATNIQSPVGMGVVVAIAAGIFMIVMMSGGKKAHGA